MNLRLFCAGILMFRILFQILSFASVAADKTLICYYNRTAHSRPDDDPFTVDNIDPYLCTHIVYSRLYLRIENNYIIADNNFYIGQKKLTELKAKHPQLKILIDLEIKPSKWYCIHVNLMASSKHVNAVTQNIVAFLEKYKFDGIILEFYPSKCEKLGFMNLVERMNKIFSPLGYFLAVFGFSYGSDSSDGYAVSSLSRDVDFLIVDAYDFHYINKERILADNPLYSLLWNTNNYTTNFAVNHWINKGFQSEKILLGISLNGFSWTLSSDDSTPPAPFKGPGPPKNHAEYKGIMSYFEICLAIAKESWQVFREPEKGMGTYAVSPGRENKVWVGYDDPTISVIKSKYILSKGLGGAAVWDVSMDDFRNKCGGGFNPMLTAIRKTLFTVSLQKIPLSNVTLHDTSMADLEDQSFRWKFVFIFRSIAASCFSITIVYMFYLCLRVILCLHELAQC